MEICSSKHKCTSIFVLFLPPKFPHTFRDFSGSVTLQLLTDHKTKQLSVKRKQKQNNVWEQKWPMTRPFHIYISKKHKSRTPNQLHGNQHTVPRLELGPAQKKILTQICYSKSTTYHYTNAYTPSVPKRLSGSQNLF